ncbi:hypothetical protein [Saccharopolyspora spinosa]|uniref:hypothetical protein n=1 Tax=Saccharopolyspora spinosa TaxID=60894 RepID=UPI000677F630
MGERPLRAPENPDQLQPGGAGRRTEEGLHGHLQALQPGADHLGIQCIPLREVLGQRVQPLRDPRLQHPCGDERAAAAGLM